MKKKEQAVWQRRFWEHLIRDEQDFIRHVEYIHYNPVRHGFVTAPKDWEYSSFHRYMRKGIYDLDWGAGVEIAFDSTVGLRLGFVSQPNLHAEFYEDKAEVKTRSAK